MTFVLIQRHVDLGVSGMSLAPQAPQIGQAWIKSNCNLPCPTSIPISVTRSDRDFIAVALRLETKGRSAIHAKGSWKAWKDQATSSVYGKRI